jgi:DNA-directed RNA polymerase subunit RPC12/RpoP
MKRGTRLYLCAECGATTPVHWVERERASRPRCGSCGSLAIDPKTDEAKREVVVGNMNRLEDARPDVKVSNLRINREESGRRRVT